MRTWAIPTVIMLIIVSGTVSLTYIHSVVSVSNRVQTWRLLHVQFNLRHKESVKDKSIVGNQIPQTDQTLRNSACDENTPTDTSGCVLGQTGEHHSDNEKQVGVRPQRASTGPYSASRSLWLWVCTTTVKQTMLSELFPDQHAYLLFLGHHPRCHHSTQNT